MKLTIGLIMISAALFGQDTSSSSAGPRFDTAGRSSEYVYPDGKMESYFYDSAGRMTRFLDRQGNVTTFIYHADGSITVVNPDGSTRH